MTTKKSAAQNYVEANKISKDLIVIISIQNSEHFYTNLADI